MRLKKQVRECGRKPLGITAASPVGAEILKGMAKASAAEGKRDLQRCGAKEEEEGGCKCGRTTGKHTSMDADRRAHHRRAHSGGC